MPSVATRAPPTMTATVPPKKKRARKESSDDGGKTSRGRPRVESHDETAADRRRTQIRLAQRAYRMRKETTITSLQDKVSELKTVVEQMSSTFLGFSDLALSSGLSSFNPQLAGELQRAAKRFALLAEQANSSLDGACDSQDHTGRPRFYDSSNGDGSNSEASQQSPPTFLDPYIEEADPSQPVQHMGFGLFTYDSDQSNAGQTSNTAVSSWSQSEAMPNDDNPRPTDEDMDLGALLRTPSPSPGTFSPSYNKMPAVFTYSFEESTFARRLHRACLERAFYVLSKPGNQFIERAFKLLLPFKGPEELRELVRGRLARGADEPLESTFYYPFSHLGGAGTHYPRAKSITFPAQMPGPKLAAWIKSQEHERSIAETVMHLPVSGNEFEGVWFDPEDVEGYLAERGIYISPQAYFAEADMMEEPPWKPHSDSAVNGQRHHRQNASDVLFGREPGAVVAEIADQLNGHNTSRSYGEQDDALMLDLGSSADFSLPTPPPSTGTVSAGTKHVVIDVSKLVDGLVNRAMCLGRTPGYRRRDVERALEKAITAF